MADFKGMLQMKAAAGKLGVSRETLRNWVRSNYGPPYYEIGRHRYYDRAELEKWIESRHIEPTR